MILVDIFSTFIKMIFRESQRHSPDDLETSAERADEETETRTTLRPFTSMSLSSATISASKGEPVPPFGSPSILSQFEATPLTDVNGAKGNDRQPVLPASLLSASKDDPTTSVVDNNSNDRPLSSENIRGSDIREEAISTLPSSSFRQKQRHRR